MPKFSIIIPAYNAEGHIRKALDSIKSQVYKDYELIVNCDRCTDNTFNIAKEYTNKVYKADFGNDGLSRSLGLDMAEGDWVMFMDDDDWWLHEYVLTMIDRKLGEKYCTILAFGFIFKGAGYARPQGNHGQHWIAVWNKVWKRRFIGNVRFPNVHSCSDRYFHNELMKHNPVIVNWDMPFYYYNYLRKGSISEKDGQTLELARKAING